MTIEQLQANRDKYKVNSLHWRQWDRLMILNKLSALMAKHNNTPTFRPMTAGEWWFGVQKILGEHIP